MNNEYYVITWGPHPFSKRYDDLVEALVKVQELIKFPERQYVRLDKFTQGDSGMINRIETLAKGNVVKEPGL